MMKPRSTAVKYAALWRETFVSHSPFGDKRREAATPVRIRAGLFKN